MMRKLLVFLYIQCFTIALSAQVWQYVDPRIGSEGVGRTFPGPSMPFGMVKPGPDCTVLPNAGWAPMPQVVTGFSQTHVSGTGGGQKYGNILIQPISPMFNITTNTSKAEIEAFLNSNSFEQKRKDESIALGYYATEYENGIRTEITTAEKCAFYRITFGNKGLLIVDASHFLGKDSVPDLRERQQFVGAEVEIVSKNEVRGYSRVRGGWNNGDAYTVYFALQSDVPFIGQTDENDQRAVLSFTKKAVNIKIGISFVSSLQAHKNIVDNNFDTQLKTITDTWEKQLSPVQIEGTYRQKRMFYTALYHSMILPVDRTGENPLWTDSPYYDDYYAIWDTYRTSSPLITLLDEKREADIVNSLLNIYRRDGYMPDARSGNCNGRTQGGSNAEVVIADAFVKNVGGIDYELALEAMLKDATVPPGGNEEKEGRGGLNEYLNLGYIPYGIPRAGNRTIEYAYDDYCIALVAKGLGREDVAEQYFRQSQNWRNLWREDYSFDGMRGFIMPKDADGEWLDDVPWGNSKVFHPTIPYTPSTKVAPWYLPWWSTFFYEATSHEYSLSVPHDVESLMELCGGKEKFIERLDTFFIKGYYNVANEPSFLTPCLYHWAGRPDYSTQRIHHIINTQYDDTPTGLPGNDDSGAMSSWLAFHMMGIYPNAGQSYYLLNVPMLQEYSFRFSNGNTLHTVVKVDSTTQKPDETAQFSVSFNGKPIENARIEHSELVKGGELEFVVRGEIRAMNPMMPASSMHHISHISPTSLIVPSENLTIHYTLNKQFRSWPLSFAWDNDTLKLICKQTLYSIPRSEVEHATGFSWLTPQKDGTTYDNVKGTFAFISLDAWNDLLSKRQFIYDEITWKYLDETDGFYHVRADIDRTEMWIKMTNGLPIVVKMKNNPLGIDWRIED